MKKDALGTGTSALPALNYEPKQERRSGYEPGGARRQPVLADHPRGEASHAHAPLRNPEPIPRRRGRPPQPPEVLAAAGAMMRERREKLGLTLAFVARRINVCNVHLSDVERGRKGISADVAEAWAKALALPVAEVCCAFRVVPEAAAERFFDPDRMREALAQKGGA